MNQPKKILTLALLFFFAGLSFFYFRMTQDSSEPETIVLQGEKLKPAEESRQIVLKNMPDPVSFKDFTYKNEDYLTVDLKCSDKYAAVLVYPKETDYRYDPLGAKFNTAYACDGRAKFEQEIYLRGANLENGLKYYLVRAKQGQTGGWYDPY